MPSKDDKSTEKTKKEFRINKETISYDRRCNGDECSIYQEDENYNFDDD